MFSLFIDFFGEMVYDLFVELWPKSLESWLIMNKKQYRLHSAKSAIRAMEGFLELLILSVVYYYIWRNEYHPSWLFPDYPRYGKYVLAGVYGLMTMFMFFNFDGFKFGYMKRVDVFLSQVLALFATNFITYWQLCLIAEHVIPVTPMLILMGIDVVLALVLTVSFDFLYHSLYVPKRMVMIYGSKDSVSLKFKMETRKDKYRMAKLIPATEGLEKICAQLTQYDAVVINGVEGQLRNDILKFCYERAIRTYIAPKISDIIIRGASEINLFDTPLLLIKGRALTYPQRILKRTFDLVVCSIATLIFSPIMILIAIAIKLEDGGPVFYRQKRATYDGRVFEILKFRSMIVDAEKAGISVPATERDPRITKVGAIIRATRVDELPQLLNILKGDMSIVGPRPERLEHMESYSREIPEFPFRLKVKGGLTGYAQIYGKYNTSPYDKLRMDMMYVENYSFFMDIKLILMTLRILMKKESTEGFDKAAELERQTEEIFAQLEKENQE